MRNTAPDRDRIGALAAAALSAAVFAPTVLRCGLYLDDFGFLRTLEGIPAGGLWLEFIRYVPGRNLHIPFFYALIRLCAGSVAAMHAVSVLLDAAAAALVFLLARRVTGRPSVALAAAAMFALMPNHGETHFWITLIAQCHVPLLLTLGAFLFALDGGRLVPAVALYALALFTYDQVFCLWPLLLAAAWRSEDSPRRGRYAAAAAACLGLNLAHISIRYLSPYAFGGRPVIRTGEVLRRIYDALRSLLSGTFPWPSTPQAHWAAIAAAAAAALAAGVLWSRTVRAWSRGESPREADLLRAAAAGAAWAALGYAPNLFWFIGPRHGLIPSVGWAIAVCSLAALAVERWKSVARAAPAVGALFFAMAAVADVCEGTQWVASRRLRERFESEARRLSEPVDSLFLIGAPRYLRRAPAFNLYADVMIAGERALGRPGIVIGGNHAASTRRGLVTFNDLSIWGPSDFYWLPAERANVLAYEPAAREFYCLSALELSMPDGSAAALPLRRSAACSRSLPMTLDAVLRESRPIPAPRAEGKGPFALGRARIEAVSGGTRLTLDWRIAAPPTGAIAVVPRVLAGGGKVLLDTVFPSRTLKGREPTLWPLVDDLARERRGAAAGGLRQVFDIRRSLPPGVAAERIELELFELSGSAPARLLARFDVPLEK